MTSQHLLCDIPCGKLTWKGDIRNSLTTPLVFTEDVGVESCSLPYHVLFPPSPLCSVPGGRCGRHGGDLSRHSWPLACSWVSTCPADGTSSQLSGGRGEIRVLVLFGFFPVRLPGVVRFPLWESVTPVRLPWPYGLFLCFALPLRASCLGAGIPPLLANPGVLHHSFLLLL